MIPDIPIDINGISRIELVMVDGTIEEVTPRHHADADNLQDRVDNLYRDEFEEGLIDTLIAYDANGEVLDRMTANKFFKERQGF